MAFTLTIKERYELRHHIGRLPCTLDLRFDFAKMQNLLDFTEDEIVSKEITIDRNTYTIQCNDDSYVVEYDGLPSGVFNAINKFIKKYDIVGVKKNEFVQSALYLFKKVV